MSLLLHTSGSVGAPGSNPWGDPAPSGAGATIEKTTPGAPGHPLAQPACGIWMPIPWQCSRRGEMNGGCLPPPHRLRPFRSIEPQPVQQGAGFLRSRDAILPREASLPTSTQI